MVRRIVLDKGLSHSYLVEHCIYLLFEIASTLFIFSPKSKDKKICFPTRDY
jgi:hypothetical protein